MSSAGVNPFDAVLLVAFGGPTAPHEIRPFLQNVARGRPIPPARLEEVAHHYEQMGGKSPLNELTFRQARWLESFLRFEGLELPVYVGMRNWHPLLAETLAEMDRKGVRRALAIILSAHDSEAGWSRYVQNVQDAQGELRAAGLGCPEILFAPNWHDAPGFIEAMACRCARAFALLPAERRSQAMVVFTAHSIPVAMAANSAYEAQFRRSCGLVAESLGHSRWDVAYQSRSGRPQDPWLEPDINPMLERLAAAGERDVVVAPIGFVCDHVEVLYDLDFEAQATANRVGLNMIRATSVNDHPAFVKMLAGLVCQAWADPSALGER